MSKYWDKYGLLHPTENGSENGILFAAYYHTLSKKHWGGYQVYTIRDAVYNTVVSYEDHRYQANPPENGDHFSHDNMTGLYALSAISIFPRGGVKKLPLMKWNDRVWWHPNGWMVYGSFKSNVFKYLSLPFLYLMMRFSMRKTDTYTSGKLLWWLIFHSLNLEWALPKADWKQIFTYYFTNGGNYNNPDHPMLDLANKVYGDK